MKGLKKVLCVVIAFLFLTTFLTSCNPKEWSRVIINQLVLIDHGDQGKSVKIPIEGWFRIACTVEMKKDSGVTDLKSEWELGKGKVYALIGDNISGLSELDGNNFMYVIYSPDGIDSAPVWNEVKTQILADLKSAGVQESQQVLNDIIRFGTQPKAELAPSSFGLSDQGGEMVQLLNLLPTSTNFAVSPHNGKLIGTWGSIKVAR